MTANRKHKAEYIATLSGELAAMAEDGEHRSLAYILRMAEMEARRMTTQSAPVVEKAA
jgi:hypothetical protein